MHDYSRINHSYTCTIVAAIHTTYIDSPVVWKDISMIWTSWSAAARWNTEKMFFHPDMMFEALVLTIWATQRTTMSRMVTDLDGE